MIARHDIEPESVPPAGQRRGEAAQLTPELRWKGQILQQAWRDADGRVEWRDVPVLMFPYGE